MNEKLNAIRADLVRQLAQPLALSRAGILALRSAIRALDSAPDETDEQSAGPSPMERRGSVAVIPIVGVITKYQSCFDWVDEWCGFAPAERIAAQIQTALEDPRIERIVLKIDSPGGYSNGSFELAERVRDANAVKPITAAISGLCCSAAFLVASQCTEISANANADIGSIGVYAVLTDDSKFWSDMGVEFNLISSGGVKGKGTDGKVDDDLRAEVQRSVDEDRDAFVAAVAMGRELDPADVLKLATGETWRGPQSKQLGLIDVVERFDDTVARITQEVHNMNLEQFRAFAGQNPDALKEAAKPLIESAVSEATAALTPKAATLEELEAAFPGDSSFVLAQAKAKASLPAAKLAHAQKLGDELKAERDKNAQLKAELAKLDPGQAGRAPVDVGPPAGGSAAAMTEERKKELLAAAGHSVR